MSIQQIWRYFRIYARRVLASGGRVSIFQYYCLHLRSDQKLISIENGKQIILVPTRSCRRPGSAAGGPGRPSRLLICLILHPSSHLDCSDNISFSLSNIAGLYLTRRGIPDHRLCPAGGDISFVRFPWYFSFLLRNRPDVETYSTGASDSGITAYPSVPSQNKQRVESCMRDSPLFQYKIIN